MQFLLAMSLVAFAIHNCVQVGHKEKAAPVLQHQDGT